MIVNSSLFAHRARTNCPEGVIRGYMFCGTVNRTILTSLNQQKFQNTVKIMALAAATKSFMLLGECVPCVKQNASKFKIKRLELDTNLLMYFRKDDFIYAHDPEKKCKTGDIVLIEQLPEKMTRLITHKVKDIIYPLGDITDPLTNKKVVAGKFRDHIEEVNKIYGKLPTAFDYDKASERGRLEDKKDFTHIETYIKYHKFENDDQPHAV